MSKEVEELKKLLDDQRTGLKESSDTNKTRMAIIEMLESQSNHQLLEEIKEWAKNEAILAYPVDSFEQTESKEVVGLWKLYNYLTSKEKGER